MPICLRTVAGSGSPFSAASTSDAIPGMVEIMRVIALGTIALTVMLCFAHSIAQVRAYAAIPALAAA